MSLHFQSFAPIYQPATIHCLAPKRKENWLRVAAKVYNAVFILTMSLIDGSGSEDSGVSECDNPSVFYIRYAWNYSTSAGIATNQLQMPKATRSD
jgi:hypothetical protein